MIERAVVASAGDWARLRGLAPSTAARYARRGLIARTRAGAVDVAATDQRVAAWRARDPGRRLAPARRRARTGDAIAAAQLRAALARAEAAERNLADLRAGRVALAVVGRALEGAAAELAPHLGAAWEWPRARAEREARRILERALRRARHVGATR